MALTKKEQRAFEEMFEEVQAVQPDSRFLQKLGDLIFEMTGNVNLRMRIHLLEKPT
jgi:hypothetical protein